MQTLLKNPLNSNSTGHTEQNKCFLSTNQQRHRARSNIFELLLVVNLIKKSLTQKQKNTSLEIIPFYV